MSVLEAMWWSAYIMAIVLAVYYNGYAKGKNDVIEELKRSIRERDGK